MWYAGLTQQNTLCASKLIWLIAFFKLLNGCIDVKQKKYHGDSDTKFRVACKPHRTFWFHESEAGRGVTSKRWLELMVFRLAPEQKDRQVKRIIQFDRFNHGKIQQHYYNCH